MDSPSSFDLAPPSDGVREDQEAAAAAMDRDIPPPPPSPLFDSFEELYDFIQGFHRDNGAALVKKSSSRKRDIRGQTMPGHYVLVCDRGPRRASESAGIRKTSTQKLDCPVKITASTTKATDWKWTYRVQQGEHNHAQSLDPSAHNIHRRRTTSQQQLERTLSKYKTLSARDMSSIIRDSSSKSNSFFRQRDIYNDRQRIRLEARKEKPVNQVDV
ncbi:hypothetical protein CDD83_4665 [Cordyceps sp. RAO-2017]|nr:hypothetical protein CDD83_4665 [Cordyceps sp. RAO-2017]